MTNLDVVTDEVLRSRKNGIQVNVSALARSKGVPASAVFQRLKKERVKIAAAMYGAPTAHPNAKPEILSLKKLQISTGAPSYSLDFRAAIVSQHLDHHISQSDLSEIYGVSTSSISKWCGTEIVRRNQASNLSGVTEHETTSTPVVPSKAEKVRALMTEYRRLTEERDGINAKRGEIMEQIALIAVGD